MKFLVVLMVLAPLGLAQDTLLVDDFNDGNAVTIVRRCGRDRIHDQSGKKHLGGD